MRVISQYYSFCAVLVSRRVELWLNRHPVLICPMVQLGAADGAQLLVAKLLFW